MTKVEIKIPDPAGIRTRISGLKGRDFTHHPMATVDYNIYSKWKKNWSASKISILINFDGPGSLFALLVLI